MVKTSSVLGWNTTDKWKSRKDLLPPKSILTKEGECIPFSCGLGFYMIAVILLDGHIWNLCDFNPFFDTLRIYAAVVSYPVAHVIDGKAIAQEIKQEIAEEVERMKSSVGKVPGLAVVLVGSRKDSETYVRSKQKACEQVGFNSFGVSLPETATEEEVLDAVRMFNCDPNVHGVLVQLPLPRVSAADKALSFGNRKQSHLP